MQTKPRPNSPLFLALNEVVRTYPVATSGTPLSMEFDPKSKVFRYKYRADKSISADTEIFLPSYQYPKGAAVSVDGGTYKLDLAHSRVDISAGSDEVTVVITSQQGLTRLQRFRSYCIPRPLLLA